MLARVENELFPFLGSFGQLLACFGRQSCFNRVQGVGSKIFRVQSLELSIICIYGFLGAHGSTLNSFMLLQIASEGMATITILYRGPND